MNTPPISIGIFIDGGYFSKINDELRHKRQLQIDIHGYLDYIRRRIARHADTDPSDCLITESHYFRGRFRAALANEKRILLTERYFEDALIDNDVIFHYKHLREVPNAAGGTTIVEKGVDVWFALEAYELTSIRKFDYVVLITAMPITRCSSENWKRLKSTCCSTPGISDRRPPPRRFLKRRPVAH